MLIFDQKKIEIENKLSTKHLLEWNMVDSESKSDGELSRSERVEKDDNSSYPVYNTYTSHVLVDSFHTSAQSSNKDMLTT